MGGKARENTPSQNLGLAGLSYYYAPGPLKGQDRGIMLLYSVVMLVGWPSGGACSSLSKIGLK
jgi:hypothetical protein